MKNKTHFLLSLGSLLLMLFYIFSVGFENFEKVLLVFMVYPLIVLVKYIFDKK